MKRVFTLILYSRSGCCLCQKLEERLRALPLEELTPSLLLNVIDIDNGELSQEERILYDLEVPVMKIDFGFSIGKYSLPRVSPRIGGQSLFNWLQKEIQKLEKNNLSSKSLFEEFNEL